MKKILFCVTLASLTASAYSQVRFTATNGEHLEMKRGNATKAEQRATRVYFHSASVPDSLEQIGILTVHMNDRAEAIEKAKIYGARATGKAVLLVDAKDQTAGQAVGQFFLRGKGFKGKYAFIVYR